MSLNDPGSVARQYATEANLEARRALYADGEGPDPREIAAAAVAETAPRRVLEVGGGPGELAARMREEVTIHDRDTGEGFVASLDLETRPELAPYEVPLRSRRASSVFVATKAT